MEHFPKAVLDHLPDPVVLIGTGRRVIDVNQAARDMLDIQRVGVDLSISLRHPDILQLVDKVLTTGQDGEVETTLSLNPPRTVRAHVERLTTNQHDVEIKAVMVITDLTALKKTEQMRADFVSNASHELRSPLSAIIGFLETLEGPAKDDEKARTRFMGIMLREAKRMTGLIDDLLSLSRVEINEHVQPSENVDILNILKSVTETLSVKADEHGIGFNTIEPEGSYIVRGDTKQLTQVFHNLIDNALKYGGDNTTIELEAVHVPRIPGRMTPGIAICVRDHGEGIPADAIPRLTERFYRADKARSRDLGSTGLGLAICKHIINRHRGHLSIESSLGEGSTFTVYLQQSS